jgi:hypothetical protein
LVSFAIVSHMIRRDLHDPLRFFEVLRPVHFFQTAPYGDMTPAELAGAHRFRNPADLFLKLRQAQPQIVQGGEPFVRRLIPNAWAVLAYSRASGAPFVVPSLENLPIAGNERGRRGQPALGRGAARPPGADDVRNVGRRHHRVLA